MTQAELEQIREALMAKKFHGSSCIDYACEDEDHGYEAISTDDVNSVLDSFEGSV